MGPRPCDVGLAGTVVPNGQSPGEWPIVVGLAVESLSGVMALATLSKARALSGSEHVPHKA